MKLFMVFLAVLHSDLASSTCDTLPHCDGDSELLDEMANLQRLDSDLFQHLYPLARVKRAFAPYRTGKEVAGQVSGALDNLLNVGYDKRIRPQVGGPPVAVTVNLSIRSMGPVDENRRAFSMDCYFRQSWVDQRLQFHSGGVDELALNWAFVAKIWVPDTFFVNGKKSYLHKITVPNRFVRIYPDGRVSYSQRLTIWAECRMDLAKFPLDSHRCPLEIGSFGHSSKDIVYNWAKPKAVSIDKLGLAQFHLTRYDSHERISVSSRRINSSYRNDSVARLDFFFERQTGFFLLQIYTPLNLIVFCSWVAFWLTKTEKGGEVPARTSLGATAVLSVVNIGFGGKSRPHVPYATAMDTFIILCFIAVFAALLEFAFISFVDTFVRRHRERSEAKKEETADDVAKSDNVDAPPHAVDDDGEFEDVVEEEKVEESQQTTGCSGTLKRVSNRCLDMTIDSVEKALVKCGWGPLEGMDFYENTTEFVWMIDEYARICFPVVFLVIQSAYWIFYLHLLK